MLRISILVLGVLAAFAISAFIYLRREPAGRGRPILIALRAASLLLIMLLLLDPHVPGSAERSHRTRVIVDASLSMRLGGAWERAVVEAASADGDVLLTGSEVRSTSIDSLRALEPFMGRSRVLPALQSAAEANAGRVLLVTDGAIDDAADVARWLPALGIVLDVRNVAGADVANRAISEVDAPAWAESGKPLILRIRRAALRADARGSIIVRQNGNVVARTEGDTVIFMASGPADGGLVRFDVAYETGDSIPDDDVRSVYVFISDKPAGVAIVSFDPDWEPRFLHPVLDAALGLPVRTFLRLPAGIYIRGGGGLEAGTRADENEVLRAAGDADLLVLHGLSGAAPPWAQHYARTGRRLIIFPGEAGIPAPVQTSGALEADWYISPDLPASPITSLLAGMDISALPPLNSLQSTTLAENAWTPLFAGRTPRGGQSPVVTGEERDGRRWAVALGRGYWRWAFRGGSAQDAYTRLWGALAGWVVQDRAQVAGSAIRPLQRAVPRATPLRWVAPGLAADSFVLALSGNGAESRSVLVAEPGDTAVSAALAPGHYTYDIRAFGGGTEIARSTGPLTMESYSPEFIRRVVDLDAMKRAPAALAGGRRGVARPLHTFAWLYVLLVALLCAEWILRRRWGLR